MACPHPRRQNHAEWKLNLPARGGLGLGHPWVGTWRGLCSRGSHSKPGRTHPLTKDILLVGFWPRKLGPPQVTGCWPAPKEA